MFNRILCKMCNFFDSVIESYAVVHKSLRVRYELMTDVGHSKVIEFLFSRKP